MSDMVVLRDVCHILFFCVSQEVLFDDVLEEKKKSKAKQKEK